MEMTNSIMNYRRYLKRRNYSAHTIKSYLNTLKHFVLWLDVPIEEVTHREVLAYIDRLLDRGIAPKTINCHLVSIRSFYSYLQDEHDIDRVNPVKRGYLLRLPKPLPRHLKDHEVESLFLVIKSRLCLELYSAKLTVSLVEPFRGALYNFLRLI